MSKYNFFISYCRTDGKDIAMQIYKQLTAKGYSVFMDIETINSSSNFFEIITEAIASCDCFVPVITENYLLSSWAKKELETALFTADNRATPVLAVLATDYIDEIPLHYRRRMTFIKFDNENLSSSSANKLVEKIDDFIGFKLKSSLLYEKLAEYKKIGNHNKEATVLCELISLNRRSRTTIPSKAWCKEMLTLYEHLSKYTGDYDKESISTAHKILKQLDITEKIWCGTEKTCPHKIFYTDIFYISFVLRMIYIDREIRSECAYITTHGDVLNPCSTAWYIEKQKVFTDAYFREYHYVQNNPIANISKDDLLFIEKTADYILDNRSIESEAMCIQKKKNIDKVFLSKDDEVLISIAKFMREGNKLFDALQKKGIAGDFLKCLLTSYERLKNYCEIVGATAVGAECVDRIVEIRNELDKSQNNNTFENEKAEKGIKSLLGFTLKNAGIYDVFISFKSEDSDLAEKIYRYCHKNMKEPFWSKKSLPELSKSEYEDAIYAALRNSKHFVVVLSNLEYLNASWVKTEMSTFHRAITEGRKTGANFVFVVTDDVYTAIINSNKMCLDERYCGYQIIKMSEYEETLAQYIS